MSDGIRPGVDDPDQPPAVPDTFAPPEVEPIGINHRKETFGEIFGGRDTGAVGFHLPERDTVYLSPRANHHNGLLSALDRTGVSLETRLVPFICDTYPQYDDGEFVAVGIEFEYPRSAGGAYQYVSRNLQGTDAELVQQSREGITLADAYAAVYAVRLLDTPDASDARLSYLNESLPSNVQQIIEDTDRLNSTVTTQTRLGELYREMRFADVLPEAVVAASVVYDI